MIVVQSVHRTPPPPTRPREWTPNAAGLFTPDIELTSGGIYVSAATMDEVEATRPVDQILRWYFSGHTVFYEEPQP